MKKQMIAAAILILSLGMSAGVQARSRRNDDQGSTERASGRRKSGGQSSGGDYGDSSPKPRKKAVEKVPLKKQDLGSPSRGETAASTRNDQVSRKSRPKSPERAKPQEQAAGKKQPKKTESAKPAKPVKEVHHNPVAVEKKKRPEGGFEIVTTRVNKKTGRVSQSSDYINPTTGVEIKKNSRGTTVIYPNKTTVKYRNGIQTTSKPAIINGKPGRLVSVAEVGHKPFDRELLPSSYHYGSRSTTIVIYRYHPAWNVVYVDPFFYFWTVPAPILYDDWGCTLNGWCDYYVGYYQPRRRYRAPEEWLADRIFADMMAERFAELDAIQRQQVANSAMQKAIDDAIKEQVSRQVKQEMDDYKAKQVAELSTVLQDPDHIFFVSDDLYPAQVGGGQCSLTKGDLVRLASTQDPMNSDDDVTMEVLAAGPDSCDPNVNVAIKVDELQDMQNDFTERLVEKALPAMEEAKAAGKLQ